MHLMSIGEFAKVSRLSPKALRLYDGSGLLTPASVDPHTGYRRYAPEQLERARWIGRLRSLDVPLSAVAELLEADPDVFAERLRAHGAELRRATAARTALIEHLLDRMDGRRSTTMNVTTREVPARRLLSCTASLTSDQVEGFAGPLFAHYGGGAVPRPEGVTGAPFLRYHGEIGPDGDGPVEFCCPITEDAEVGDEGELRVVREEPARHAVVAVAKRDAYSQLGFEVLGDWATEQGVRPSGLPEQIFLADPRTIGDDDTVYEIAIPVSGTPRGPVDPG